MHWRFEHDKCRRFCKDLNCIDNFSIAHLKNCMSLVIIIKYYDISKASSNKINDKLMAAGKVVQSFI